MRKFFEKVPWGFVAGAFGILCFYCIVDVVAAVFVFTQVNGQTGQDATIFDSWWQILLFVGAVIFALAFAGSLTLFIRKKLRGKQGGTNIEKIA